MAIELEDTLAAAQPAATATDATRVKPAAPGAELVAGSRLGHFQIVKKLGAGGMGEVYLAQDLALDRPVAIKVLPGGAATGIARDRLVREARAQARVHHPNVAHIYFIGEDDDTRLYFAMEYVTGKTLADATANGPLPVEDALSFIHAAALGLREAQRSGFTHRDVKPSNLMVDAHGVVKVLDFGIAAGGRTEDAKSSSKPNGPVAVTQTSLAGTPLYMAPEQARGEPVDSRADIYALGATLYQLVSGKPPFQADSFAELVTLHASAERPALPRGVATRTQSTALDAMIAKMMAPRPEDRFATYDDLLRAIENVSTQFTRPAGFWVRTIGMGVDLLVMMVLLAVTEVVIFGVSDVKMGDIGMPLLAIMHLVLVARFGTTLGGALFELEVVDVQTGLRPAWQVAATRSLFVYGPLVFLAWIGTGLERMDVAGPVDEITAALFGLTIVIKGARLAYASWRVPGKRAPWDRRSGTMVRYRSGRRPPPGASRTT